MSYLADSEVASRIHQRTDSSDNFFVVTGIETGMQSVKPQMRTGSIIV